MISSAWRDQETGSCFLLPPHPPARPRPRPRLLTPSVCFTVLHTMRRRKTRSRRGSFTGPAQGCGRGRWCQMPRGRAADRLGWPRAESMALKGRPTPPLYNQYLKFISLCSQVLVISIYLYTAFVLFWPRSISVSHFSSMPFFCTELPLAGEKRTNNTAYSHLQACFLFHSQDGVKGMLLLSKSQLLLWPFEAAVKRCLSLPFILHKCVGVLAL